MWWIAAVQLAGSASPQLQVDGPELWLREACGSEAAASGAPWALAHAVTALGSSFRAADGRLATEVMLAGLRLDDRRTPVFPAATSTGLAADTHPWLELKTMLLAEVPRGRRLASGVGPITLDQLASSAASHFDSAASFGPEGAWQIEVLAQTLEPGAHFRDARGEDRTIDAVMDEALARLEEANRALEAALLSGHPVLPKDGTGIYAHPCGGLHYVQAVSSWARHASVRKRWEQRLERQREILFYRLSSELEQYDAALRSAPEQSPEILGQILKFLGHWLETVARARDELHWRPTPKQSVAINEARARLGDTASRLQRLGLPSPWPLDLLGDSCHAAHGLALWSKPASLKSGPRSPGR